MVRGEVSFIGISLCSICSIIVPPCNALCIPTLALLSSPPRSASPLPWPRKEQPHDAVASMPVPGVDLFLKTQSLRQGRPRRGSSPAQPLIRDRSDSVAHLHRYTAPLFISAETAALYTGENYRALMKPIPHRQNSIYYPTRALFARPTPAAPVQRASFFLC